MDTSKITGLHQIGIVSGAELEQLARSPYTSPRVLRELANSSSPSPRMSTLPKVCYSP